eukprot:CAMPEP_0203967048 /NCGR_PEP_ID=MMETSP0359-20131031/96131_1 /ASSEMBLY_ACC=CAM_ASM_000338 /TAXON_ID=268821 /ORGANISM="Scrippsiella Hangoei, Strain SHTV-5" /LENGTH=301 /DNA_ID=CAMNT_0050904733 /DNA_START=56 /DNA_END=962 /DNA_ORIENTATION=-
MSAVQVGRMPSALREIVLAERCEDSDDEEPSSPNNVVAVDSDTAVPADLYQDLICAGERARARGQHRIARGRSDSRPHLVRARASSLPKLPQAGSHLHARRAHAEGPCEWWDSDKSTHNKPPRGSLPSAFGTVLVPLRVEDFEPNYGLDLARTPVCCGVVVDRGDTACKECLIDVGPAESIAPSFDLSRRRGKSLTSRKLAQGPTGAAACTRKLPPIPATSTVRRLTGFLSSYVSGAKAMQVALPGLAVQQHAFAKDLYELVYLLGSSPACARWREFMDEQGDGAEAAAGGRRAGCFACWA